MGVPRGQRSAYRRSANSLMHDSGVTSPPPTGDPILATKTNRYSTTSD